MMFNKRYQKYWKIFGGALAILVVVSMVLLYAVPGLAY